jgi:two-component sensor histidine kinase/PAS domain-containing protein
MADTTHGDNEYSLAHALGDITDAIWVVAPDSTLAYVNRAAVRFHADMYGTRASVGALVSDLYPPAVRQLWTDRYRKAADGTPVFTLEVHRGADSEQYYELLFDGARATESGQPVVVVGRPISGRRGIMPGITLEARAVVDADGYVLFAEQRFKEMVGIQAETPIRSMRIQDLLDPEDEPVFLRVIATAGEEARPIDRLRLVDLNGRVHQVVGAVMRSPGSGNLAITLLDITSQIEAELRLEQQAEHLRALHAWAAELNVYMDRSELLYERSLKLLRNTVRYDSASVQIREGDDLVIVACAGFEAPESVTGLRFPFDSRFPNWHVVTSRKAVAVTNVADEYPHFQKLAGTYQSASIMSWLGVPLAVRGEIVGMIALDRTDPVAFSEEEQRLVTTMAGRIAVAVHNSQLYLELQRSEERFRDANRQKEVLLRELHHRSKNNMQMVSSLLSLGAAAVSVEEDGAVLDEVRLRIQSLAAIHEELYRSDNLDRVDLAEYTERLALMISESYGRPGITCTVEAHEVSAGVDLSVPFGLILSELILNSYKHAFPGNAVGTIRVEVSRNDDEGKLVVSDDGIGLSREDLDNSGDSLGMQLVTGLVEQVGGTLDLSDGTGGPGRSSQQVAHIRLHVFFQPGVFGYNDAKSESPKGGKCEEVANRPVGSRSDGRLCRVYRGARNGGESDYLVVCAVRRHEPDCCRR